jgi:HlyD family secretion protein
MVEERRKRISSGALWIAAAIALLLIFFGVRRLTREKLPVRVAEAHVQDLIKPSSTSGRVEPLNIFEAHAPEATTVKAVYVHVGERVHPGQLLVTLDDTNARARLAAATAALRAAEAGYQSVESGGTHQEQLALSSNLAKAQIDCDQAARDLDVVQKLAAKGAAAPSEVAQAQTRLTIAQASLHSLQEQKTKPFAPVDLTRAHSTVAEAQAAVDAANRVIAQSHVRAPFACTVYSLPVTRYGYIEPGAEILQAADLSKLQVRAYFDEPEIGDLKLNDPVSIVWNAKPDMTFHGHITGLPSTIITYTTRQVGEVLVSVEDSNGVLLPNTNVVVTVITQEVRHALTVPREALHIEGGRDYVYVVSGDTLHRAPVQVGAINLTMVQILSGLKDGTVVALGTTNGAPISEGAPIRIVN